MSSIFLSHNLKDKPFVRQLANRLAEAGLAVWLDEAKLKIGDSLIQKISKAINEVEYVAAIISKNSIQSRWVQKELSLSLSKEINNSKPIVLPIRIDDCDMPIELQDKLYADFRDPNNFNGQCKMLLNTMGFGKKGKDTKPGMVVEWTSEGPSITGNGVVLSPSESNALMDRYIKRLPEFIDSEKERRGTEDVLDSASFLAILRACGDTFNRIPDEDEMKQGVTELSRKFDLFFEFIHEMHAELYQQKSKKPLREKKRAVKKNVTKKAVKRKQK